MRRTKSWPSVGLVSALFLIQGALPELAPAQPAEVETPAEDGELADGDLADTDLPGRDLPDGDLPDEDLSDRDLPDGDLGSED